MGKTRRKRPLRSERKRILVVTEGKVTEKQYVERLQQHLRSRGSTTDVKPIGVGKDPLKVVREAVRFRVVDPEHESYDHYIALVDVDTHATLPDAVALAAKGGIELLISNLKFEVWLRWHYEEKTSALSTKQLDNLMAKASLMSGKTLHRRFPVEKVDQACAVARRVHPELGPGIKGPDPSSAMPYLVDLMR